MDPKNNSPRTEPVELTDEDLQAAAGGAVRPAPVDPPDPDLIGLLAQPPDPEGIIVPQAQPPEPDGVIIDY